MIALLIRRQLRWSVYTIRAYNVDAVVDLMEMRFALYDDGMGMKDTYMIRGTMEEIEEKVVELNKRR